MNRRPLPKGTASVIAICVLIWLAGFFASDLNDAEKAIFSGAYYKPMILSGEWWRLFTAGFVHLGFLHLLMNMSALWSLGESLERILGTRRFLLILFSGVVSGNLLCFGLDGNTVAAGLSGGLYGLLGVYTVLLVRAGVWRNPEVRRSMIMTFAVNLLINFLPGISYYGHLGGLAGGLAVWLASEKGLHAWYRIVLPCLCAGLLVLLPFQNAVILEDEQYIGSDYKVLKAEKRILPDSYVRHMAERLDTIYQDGGILEAALFGGE